MRVDAGGVRRGELGQVADAHEHLGIGIAAPDLGVALERRHEAVPIGSRIGSIRYGTPAASSAASVGLERVERAAEIGHGDDPGPAAGQVRHDRRGSSG